MNTKTAQFAWKDISIVVEGRPFLGATNVEYGKDKTIEHIFGAGNKPQFVGEGNEEPGGTLEMLQTDYQALVAEAKARGGSSVTDLEISIIVAYIPKEPANLPKTVIDRIVGVKFNTSKKQISQGATHMLVSLPFLALDIEEDI